MIDLDLGDGARLRSLGAADAAAMHAVLEADREHFDRWLRWSGSLKSPADTERFLAGFTAQEARGDGFHLGIFQDGALAGGVICWAITPRHRIAEVGYWLGTRHLGRGLVTRAVAAAVAHLFDALGARRVEILCAVENLRSRAVPERLGFRLEGVRPGSHPVGDGRLADRFAEHVVYARLAGDAAPGPGSHSGRLLVTEEFQALLDRLAAGWSGRDYAAVAAEFAEDVRYADPTRYAHAGRAALRAFFEDDAGREQRVTWHTVVFDPARQVGAVEYTYDGTHRYHGTVLVRLAGGAITHWREYQHVDDRAWEDFAGGTRFP